MTRISDDSLVTGFGEELLEDKGTFIPAISCDSKKKVFARFTRRHIGTSLFMSRP